MNRRFIICALGISSPGSMGGNSKIALELIRTLARQYPVVVITTADKLPTFEQNITLTGAIRIYTVPKFGKNPMPHPLQEGLHYTRKIRPVLAEINANENDILYSCSDFLLDVLPAFLNKPEFRFTWMPTLFLFVPFVVENIRRRYQFPVLKYLIYYFWQRIIFQLIKTRGDLFVITNDCDKKQFPRRLQARVFAFYGGVNSEQVRKACLSFSGCAKRYDALFCSRLHPQKGISSLLNIWKVVAERCPGARLGIIGNGDFRYETFLKDKARRLGVDAAVDWLGYINNEEKYHLYQQARIFVHATVYDNNGMVAAEALCSGLPVVLYDLPALRHVYTQGCLKVPPNDQKAYAEAIVTLLTVPATYRSVKPSPETCEYLLAEWDWPRRAEIFDAFMTTHRGWRGGHG